MPNAFFQNCKQYSELTIARVWFANEFANYSDYLLKLNRLFFFGIYFLTFAVDAVLFLISFLTRDLLYFLIPVWIFIRWIAMDLVEGILSPLNTFHSLIISLFERSHKVIYKVLFALLNSSFVILLFPGTGILIISGVVIGALLGITMGEKGQAWLEWFGFNWFAFVMVKEDHDLSLLRDQLHRRGHSKIVHKFMLDQIEIIDSFPQFSGLLHEIPHQERLSLLHKFREKLESWDDRNPLKVNNGYHTDNVNLGSILCSLATDPKNLQKSCFEILEHIRFLIKHPRHLYSLECVIPPDKYMCLIIEFIDKINNFDDLRVVIRAFRKGGDVIEIIKKNENLIIDGRCFSDILDDIVNINAKKEFMKMEHLITDGDAVIAVLGEIRNLVDRWEYVTQKLQFIKNMDDVFRIANFLVVRPNDFFRTEAYPPKKYILELFKMFVHLIRDGEDLIAIFERLKTDVPVEEEMYKIFAEQMGKVGNAEQVLKICNIFQTHPEVTKAVIESNTNQFRQQKDVDLAAAYLDEKGVETLKNNVKVVNFSTFIPKFNAAKKENKIGLLLEVKPGSIPPVEALQSTGQLLQLVGRLQDPIHKLFIIFVGLKALLKNQYIPRYLPTGIVWQSELFRATTGSYSIIFKVLDFQTTYSVQEKLKEMEAMQKSYFNHLHGFAATTRLPRGLTLLVAEYSFFIEPSVSPMKFIDQPSVIPDAKTQFDFKGSAV